MLTDEDLGRAIRCNSYLGFEDPKAAPIFLKADPAPTVTAAVDAPRLLSECYTRDDRTLYLLAPDGIARPRLAAGIEGTLGVAATASDWRTVMRLQTLAGEPDP